jgi:hypothetical protein
VLADCVRNSSDLHVGCALSASELTSMSVEGGKAIAFFYLSVLSLHAVVIAEARVIYCKCQG